MTRFLATYELRCKSTLRDEAVQRLCETFEATYCELETFPEESDVAHVMLSSDVDAFRNLEMDDTIGDRLAVAWLMSTVDRKHNRLH